MEIKIKIKKDFKENLLKTHKYICKDKNCKTIYLIQWQNSWNSVVVAECDALKINDMKNLTLGGHIWKV